MSYFFEWSGAVVLMGLVLLIVPPVSMLVLVVVVLGAGAALVALVGAIVATPFLLLRAVRRRWRRVLTLRAHTQQATLRRA